MKCLIAIAALVAVAAADSVVSPKLAEAVMNAKWSAFKAQHGKSYKGAHIESAKRAVFMKNTQVIEEHNARFHSGQESFQMCHNELSDLTLEEVKSTRMGLKLPADVQEKLANCSQHVTSPAAHPDSLDWRTWGGVQKVKDQGQCGSCYAFSAAGAMETAYWRSTDTLLDLSEQVLVDCTGEYGNYGCGGGWMHDCFRWVKDKRGFVRQIDYPYTGTVGSCQHANKWKAGTVSRYVRIPQGDENALLDAVATVGAVAIGYNAGTQQHSNYKSGILDVPNCGNTPTHAVLLIGYGTEGGQCYWLLKNSWGTWWGDNGYFKMARGKNMCGIADWASYPYAARM